MTDMTSCLDLKALQVELRFFNSSQDACGLRRRAIHFLRKVSGDPPRELRPRHAALGATLSQALQDLARHSG